MDKTEVGLDDSSEVKTKTTVNDDDLDKQGVPSQVKTKTKTKTRLRPLKTMMIWTRKACHHKSLRWIGTSVQQIITRSHWSWPASESRWPSTQKD